MTVLDQDIGDGWCGFGGDSSAPRLGRWLPMNRSIHVSAWQSRNGRYKVDGRLACEQILVVTDGDNITAADLDGEVLIEHTRPAPGVRYVGNGKPRGPRQDR